MQRPVEDDAFDRVVLIGWWLYPSMLLWSVADRCLH